MLFLCTLSKIIVEINFYFSDIYILFLHLPTMNDGSSSNNDGVSKRKRHVRKLLLII